MSKARLVVQSWLIKEIQYFVKGSAPLQAMNTFSRVWKERSLDDSALRRIMIPEIFLGADSWLRLLIKIKSRLVVHQAIIQKR